VPGCQVSRFQRPHLCAQLVVQGSACTVLLIYRPGSAAVDSLFFEEFSLLLDEVATRSEPVIVAGDFNIRLDRRDSCDSRHLIDVFDSYSLRCCVSSQTHDRGGILDVVATRTDLDTPDVDVLDVGISDHQLLRWFCQLERPPPVYHTSTYRPWRHVNVDEFKASLSQSTLCTYLSDCGDGVGDEDTTANSLVDKYASITSIADRVAPIKTTSCRRRASDVWFDEECL